jgi:hypothetical protein
MVDESTDSTFLRGVDVLPILSDRLLRFIKPEIYLVFLKHHEVKMLQTLL